MFTLRIFVFGASKRVSTTWPFGVFFFDIPNPPCVGEGCYHQKQKGEKKKKSPLFHSLTNKILNFRNSKSLFLPRCDFVLSLTSEKWPHNSVCLSICQSTLLIFFHLDVLTSSAGSPLGVCQFVGIRRNLYFYLLSSSSFIDRQGAVEYLANLKTIFKICNFFVDNIIIIPLVYKHNS